jgi:hypothetical protein
MGQVYVLTNISMPGLVKVGRSAVASARAEQLSQSTAVPTRFDVAYVQTVDDEAEVERLAHGLLIEVRVNPQREFFLAKAATAASAVQLAALMAAWNRAGTDARQKFLERVDGPAFDRGAA